MLAKQDFRQAVQGESESVADFVRQLVRLFQHQGGIIAWPVIGRPKIHV